MKREGLKVKFLVGIPASGKTTWSKEYVRNNSNWTRINRDDFRFMTKDSPVCEPKIEDMITDMFLKAVLTALKYKQNVIIDNTNLKARYITPIVEAVQDLAAIEYQIFDISIDKAIERDNNREKKVGENVIKKMFKDYKNLLDTYNFTNVGKKIKIYNTKPDWRTHLPNAAIFDIDGTLAHMNGKREPYDYHKVDVDDADPYLVRMTKVHRHFGDKIIILSGRDVESKDLTVEWMKFYDIEHDFIFMRKNKDYRKDSIVKKEIYENDVIGKFNIVAIYDDRQQVVNMLRDDLGLKVFQVEPHDF